MNRKIIFQLSLLFTIGTVLGLGSNLLRSENQGRIAWSTNWSESTQNRADKLGIQLVELKQVEEWARDGSRLLLDARPPEEYEDGHIPGSMSLPYHFLDKTFPDIQLFLTPEQPVVCYCSGEDCEDSLLLGEFLIQQGYTNIFLFEGGMNQWRAANFMEESS